MKTVYTTVGATVQNKSYIKFRSLTVPTKPCLPNDKAKINEKSKLALRHASILCPQR